MPITLYFLRKRNFKNSNKKLKFLILWNDINAIECVDCEIMGHIAQIKVMIWQNNDKWDKIKNKGRGQVASLFHWNFNLTKNSVNELLFLWF